jgi:hypothetical protein
VVGNTLHLTSARPGDGTHTVKIGSLKGFPTDYPRFSQLVTEDRRTALRLGAIILITSDRRAEAPLSSWLSSSSLQSDCTRAELRAVMICSYKRAILNSHSDVCSDVEQPVHIMTLCCFLKRKHSDAYTAQRSPRPT